MKYKINKYLFLVPIFIIVAFISILWRIKYPSYFQREFLGSFVLLFALIATGCSFMGESITSYIDNPEKANYSIDTLFGCVIIVSAILFSLFNIFINPVKDFFDKEKYERYLQTDISVSQYKDIYYSHDTRPEIKDYLYSKNIELADIDNIQHIADSIKISSWIFSTEDKEYFKDNRNLQDFIDKNEYYKNGNHICSQNHLNMEPEYCILCGISKTDTYLIIFGEHYKCSECGNLLGINYDFCKLCGSKNLAIDRLKLSVY